MVFPVWVALPNEGPSSFLLSAWETRGSQKGPALTFGKSPTRLDNFRFQILICLHFTAWEKRG